jgi:hypothetical protein
MYRILTVYRLKEAQIRLFSITSLIVELAKVQQVGLKRHFNALDVKKHKIALEKVL